MAIFLDRVDTASTFSDNFSYDFKTWIAVFIDTINETISTVQDRLNKPQLEPTNQAQIISESATAPDGSLWYCDDHVPPVFVGKINGALVQFTTAAFP